MATTDRSPHTASFIVDNSVWARLSTSPAIAAAFRALINLHNPANMLMCAPVAAEFGFSARSGRDHSELLEQLAAFPECSLAPSSAEVLEVQNRLWNNGLLRAAGATDTLIAAYALKNDSTVLHYDSDFDHLAAVTPGLRTQWILPKGTA